MRIPAFLLAASLALLPLPALAQSQPSAGAVTTIPCNQLPALTGDITTSQGACATTLAVPATARSAFKVTSVNFNSANTDTSIAITLPPGAWGYTVTAIRIGNASASISTATVGVFTAAGGGGTAVISAGTAVTITTSALATNNNAMALGGNNTNTIAYNNTTLFFRVGTAQGSAATADVTIECSWLY